MLGTRLNRILADAGLQDVRSVGAQAYVGARGTHRTMPLGRRCPNTPYPRTPAMAAGIEDHIWTLTDIVRLLD